VRIVAEVAYGSPHGASGHLHGRTPAGPVVRGARR
jgi:hypothetical protein